jgi:hypothetical protein
MAKATNPRPTTPEEEGIELHPDAWERFKKTFHKVVKARPAHRAVKTTGEDHPSGKDRARAKSNG